MSTTEDMQYLKDLVKNQQAKIETLERQVQMALKQAESAEQYTRQDCLILRGKLDIRPNHSLREEVARLIHYHTGINFPAWCLNTAHWLGKKDSIIVRFNNKEVREAIYRNRVPKDPERRGLFIHESLTSTKMQMVSKCAQLRREGKVSTYFTQGGNVYVKKHRDAPSILIKENMTDADILEQLRQQPSSYRDAVSGAQPHTGQSKNTDRREDNDTKHNDTHNSVMAKTTHTEAEDSSVSECAGGMTKTVTASQTQTKPSSRQTMTTRQSKNITTDNTTSATASSNHKQSVSNQDDQSDRDTKVISAGKQTKDCNTKTSGTAGSNRNAEKADAVVANIGEDESEIQEGDAHSDLHPGETSDSSSQSPNISKKNRKKKQNKKGKK